MRAPRNETPPSGSSLKLVVLHLAVGLGPEAPYLGHDPLPMSILLPPRHLP